MNINLLKIFYYAAKFGSISAAAEALCVTQPAVTKGIQRLHEFYGIKFLNLYGRKLALTDAGEILYTIAEKIFEIEKQAEELIRDFQERRKGHIRILASESFGAYYLPFIIIPFSSENPQIRVSVTLLPTELVVEGTAGLNCDIGFISYHVDHRKLVVREVLEDRIVVIVPPGHPLETKGVIEPLDLDGESIVTHERGSAPQRILQELIDTFHLNVNTPLELSSNESIKRAVAGGLGISIVPQMVAGEEVQAGKLVAIPLSDTTIRRKFYLVHHKDKYFSESLQKLVDMVYQWADEYAKSVSWP
ncbi:MAG: LysR family transcriptional regulator [Syntrophobacteraceae bacterium]|nr:LysR family transcriptional regulator [Desulfobacteraceae bacterium]